MDATDPVLAKLEAIEAKLDYVVGRQRYVEELVRDMTPVAREASTHLAGVLADAEARGWFALGREAVGLVDRLATAYGPDEVHALSEHVVQLAEVIRGVTQPGVLDFAADATEAVAHADDLDRVGPLGLAKATADADVQRGLAVALEVLRHLGQARTAAPRRARPAPVPDAPVPKAPEACELPAPPPAPDEVVTWNGHRFTAEGYLLDREAWSDDLARAMAEGLGLTLTDAHWQVLRWAREEHARTGATPNVRRLGAGSGADTRALYTLFPPTPGKTVAMIAGLPKPVGCL